MENALNKDIVYKEISQSFVGFRELINIPVKDNQERMIDVSSHGLLIDHSYSALPKSSGDTLLLRQSVCERLVEAEALLKNQYPGYGFALVYAYRSLSIQQEKFESMKRELGFATRTDDEAYEQIHHFIAVPEVAGHPTGGAIDLLIIDSAGHSLDFGTQMHEMVKDSYVFSPFVSLDAQKNRRLLRNVMMQAGFAPYDGEWWHFSYGDREWAAYYKKTHALYNQLPYNPDWLVNS